MAEDSGRSSSPAAADSASALAQTLDGAAPLSEAADGPPPVSVAGIPHRIGRFVILRQLGAGGMGVVYAAYDEQLDRRVAVKLVRHDVSTNEDQRVRILREAQAMAQVSHPNVVPIYEVGEVEDRVFIAMEYVDGTTLSGWQKGRAWTEVLRMYLAAGQGLLAAHSVGIIHRDFKPDNVLVGNDGRPRVADFGLARTQKLVEPQATAATENQRIGTSPGSALAARLTAAGALMGTPGYMSPEQTRGEQLDSRSDQFSFCAALYESLYQQPAFSGDSLADLLRNVERGIIQPVPAGSPVPDSIAQTLRRGLSVDPAARFPSMTELLRALDSDHEQDPRAHPQLRRYLIAGLVTVPGIAVTGVAAMSRHTAVSMQQSLGIGVGMLACALAASWFLRHRLRHNKFHWGLLQVVSVIFALVAGCRLIALLTGQTLRQEAAMETMGVACVSMLASLRYLRSGWIIAVIMLCTSLWISLAPTFNIHVLLLAYCSTTFVLVFAWTRAARLTADPAPGATPAISEAGKTTG